VAKRTKPATAAIQESLSEVSRRRDILEIVYKITNEYLSTCELRQVAERTKKIWAEGSEAVARRAATIRDRDAAWRKSQKRIERKYGPDTPRHDDGYTALAYR
jgi:hypothetical protein